MKRSLIILCLLVISFSLVIGCAKPAPAPAPTPAATGPRYGGTLVIGLEGDTGILDPQVNTPATGSMVLAQYFEGLATRDLTAPNEGKAPPTVPQLATSWEISPDGLTYTFHLRKGVKFTDGTPFNADAVKFNWRRIADKSFEYYQPQADALKSTYFPYTKDCVVLDESTVQFVQEKASSSFMDGIVNLAGFGQFYFISPEAVKKWGNDEIANHPVGTGPYKFVERIPGDRIVLERNDDWWGGRAYADKIIFRVLIDPSTRVNALRTGEADMISAVPPDSIESLEADGFKMAKGITPHIWFFNFNVANPPFNDIRVRKAVSMAIDKAGMSHSLLRDTAIPAFSMLSRTTPSYDPSWKEMYPYNIDQAKKLLNEAGYANGFTTTIQTSTSGSGQMIPIEMAQWIQRDLAKVGITAKIETYEWLTYIDMFVSGAKPGVGMMQISWGETPALWFKLLCPGGLLNNGHIEDAKMTDMLDKSLNDPNDAKRMELERQLHVYAMEQAYYLPVVNDQLPFAMSPKVKGFVRAPEWIAAFWNVWLEE